MTVPSGVRTQELPAGFARRHIGPSAVEIEDMLSAVEAESLDELGDFERRIGAILKQPGPVFVDIRVAQGELGPREYEDMYSPPRRRALRDALDA